MFSNDSHGPGTVQRTSLRQILTESARQPTWQKSSDQPPSFDEFARSSRQDNAYRIRERFERDSQRQTFATESKIAPTRVWLLDSDEVEEEKPVYAEELSEENQLLVNDLKNRVRRKSFDPHTMPNRSLVLGLLRD